MEISEKDTALKEWKSVSEFSERRFLSILLLVLIIFRNQ